MADEPKGTISRAVPLKRLNVTSVAMTGVIRSILDADQVYVCLWSHMGWTPGHIHFVLQPSWNRLQERYPRPGPRLQVAMSEEGAYPAADEVEAFCDRAREAIAAF